MVPEGWIEAPLGKLLTPVVRRVSVDPSETYHEIGVRSHGKGIFYKDPVTGREIGNKRVFWVVPDCLVLNIIFAWEQAIARTTHADVGKIASHRFPMYRPHPDKVDLDYLTYLFRTPYGRHLLALASPGGAGRNKTLGQKAFRNTVVRMPPLPEQRRIAELLSTWDRAIETVGDLIHNGERQRRGLMQRLLTGKWRFAQFANDSWDVAPLKKLCAVRRGASPRPIQDPRWFANEGRGWVRISDVTASDTERLEATTQYLSPLGVEKSVQVEPGELIMTICATIGVPKVVGIPVCIHDGFVVFRNLSSALDRDFLYHVLGFYTQRLANSGQPGTQKNLNTTIVGNITVPTISVEEQRAITGALDAVDGLLRTQKSLLQQLRLQKQALMQQLLTGKRRLLVKGAA